MKVQAYWIIGLIALICGGLGYSCLERKITGTEEVPREKTAFYNFKFRYDSLDKKTIISINSIKVVDQKINYLADEDAAKKNSNIHFEITDRNGNIIRAYIEHPLHRRFDVYEENGKIDSKMVSLPEADMTIRVPYYSPFKKIKITETINQTQTLITVLKDEK
jgi:5-bromo-4-chloroindolyl phosphate hydrolysis protein